MVASEWLDKSGPRAGMNSGDQISMGRLQDWTMEAKEAMDPERITEEPHLLDEIVNSNRVNQDRAAGFRS